MVSHGPERKSPFGGMTRPGLGGNIGLPDFPLLPPGICGARFLRQQEAGVSRLWALRHTQGVRTQMPKPWAWASR